MSVFCLSCFVHLQVSLRIPYPLSHTQSSTSKDNATIRLVTETLVPKLEAAALEFNYVLRSQQLDRQQPIQSFDLKDCDTFFESVVPE